MSVTLRTASKNKLKVQDKTYHFYSLALAARQLGDIHRLPKSLKVLLENLLRWQDEETVTEQDIHAFVQWLKEAHIEREIAYRPSRVLMQDFTGVPAVVDLAAMREAVPSWIGCRGHCQYGGRSYYRSRPGPHRNSRCL